MDTDRYDLSLSEIDHDPDVVGVTCHSEACYDDDGKCECVCGYADEDAYPYG